MDVVTYEVVDGVAWLTINRPEARNALSKDVRDGLWEGTHRFVADDAAAHVHGRRRPDLLVVNPPRRGIGPDLCRWADRYGVPHVLYSSCNARTLADDLARMPSLIVVAARVFAMFPQTRHHEVLVQLARR